MGPEVGLVLQLGHACAGKKIIIRELLFAI